MICYLYSMKTNYTIYKNGAALMITSNIEKALSLASDLGLTIISNLGLPTESILISYEGKNA